MDHDRLSGAERQTDSPHIAKASQEARWADCSIEVKIERLRSVLRNLEEAQWATGTIAAKAHEVALDHCHDVAGRVMRVVEHGARNLGSDGPFGFHRVRRHSLLD